MGDDSSSLDLRFRSPEQGILIERLNRFLTRVKLGRRGVDCFTANPGKRGSSVSARRTRDCPEIGKGKEEDKL